MLLKISDKINALLPSVLSTTNAANVTERYKHIQTSEIIDQLWAQGFTVVGQRGRMGEHSNHGVLLINREVGFLDNTGSDNFATVSIFNSHNGKSSATLIAGFFRQICSNGMIAGKSTDYLRVRHTQRGVDQLPQVIEQLPLKIAAFRDNIQFLQSTEVNEMQAGEIALELFDRVKHTRKISNPESLLFVRRQNDTGMDAWTLANVLQENLIRGGMLTESGRRLRSVNALNAQNKLTAEVMNTVENYLKRAA